MRRALAVAKRGGEGGGTRLVVAGCAAVVGGRVDGHGPHAGGVAVAVAVVVGTAVARRPHVDVSFAIATLQREVSVKSNAAENLHVILEY